MVKRSKDSNSKWGIQKNACGKLFQTGVEYVIPLELLLKRIHY